MQNNWYKRITSNIANELKGYFKFRVDENTYNVFWQGLGNKVSIVEHNLPDDLFATHFEEIMNLAEKESYKAYQEYYKAYQEQMTNPHAFNDNE